jgi:hypothetical protein
MKRFFLLCGAALLAPALPGCAFTLVDALDGSNASSPPVATGSSSGTASGSGGTESSSVGVSGPDSGASSWASGGSGTGSGGVSGSAGSNAGSNASSTGASVGGSSGSTATSVYIGNAVADAIPSGAERLTGGAFVVDVRLGRPALSVPMTGGSWTVTPYAVPLP